LRNSISKQLDIKGRNTKILNLKRAIIEKKNQTNPPNPQSKRWDQNRQIKKKSEKITKLDTKKYLNLEGWNKNNNSQPI